jgi:hypothetical protein
MRAAVVLMGKRIDMTSRRRRRALVVAIYAVLAALTGCGWWIDRWQSTGSWLIWATLLACWLFLGGHYSRGLVKQFNGKGPRNADAMPSHLQLLFGLYRAPADVSEYRNDERELRDRDRAHYLAYQAMGWVLAALWLPAFLLVSKPEWLTRLSVSMDRIVFGLVVICFVVYTTLPQAILLWTEPDS